MGCLYGHALDAVVVKNNDNDMFDEYTDWNWLIHDFTDFMYQKSPECAYDGTIYTYPVVPLTSHSIWGMWFNSVIAELRTEFNDVNPELCLRVLENCPAEEVAMMIFKTIELKIVIEFISKYIHNVQI